MRISDIQTLYQDAIKFTAGRHSNQKVPGTDLPYVVHLSNVAMEIFVAAIHTGSFNLSLAVQVALLHDTLEDTETTFDELSDRFGQDVADSVLALTKNHELPKEKQMEESLERIRKQPKEIWAVKMADRITNLQPPPKHWNKEKRKNYQGEARIIHENLKDGNRYLADRLMMKINDYENYI